MNQRWFLRIHGQITEVTVDVYLEEAKRRDWMGITRKDGSVPTHQDFDDLFAYGPIQLRQKREAAA